jgi:hypothetical protein
MRTIALVLSSICIMLTQEVYGQRVPREAIEGWKWLQNDLSTVNGLLKESLPLGTVRFAFQGQLGKFESSNEVILYNHKYSFKLSKKKTGNYSLGSVGTPKSDERIQQLSAYVKMCTAVGGIALLDAVVSKDFEFSDWKVEPSGLCSCKLTCIAPDADRQRLRLFNSLVAEFDSKAHYRVVRYIENRSFPAPMAIETTAEYGEFSLPVCVRTSVKVGDKPVSLKEVTYSDVSRKTLPKSEFTLAHYGLPEYASPTVPWSMQFKLFVFVAFVALCGIGFGVVKRLRANKVTGLGS